MAGSNEPKFQVMPSLTADEEEALRVQIAKHGVLDPVLIDTEGNILSGHHRVKIATELGIEYPTRVIDLEGDDEKIAFAVTYEMGRRHLGNEGKRALAEMLSQMGHSIRQIAELTGIPKSTVGRLLNPPPAMNAEQLTKEIVALFTHALLDIEEARKLMEEAIAEGIRFNDLEFAAIDAAPEQLLQDLEPILELYRKTVASLHRAEE